GVSAIAGWVRLNGLLVDSMYGTGPDTIAAEGIARDSMTWLTEDFVKPLPPDAPLLLVGDAQAFWYPLPMTRLRYRTVFDADTSGGRGVPEAWGVPEARGARVLVDPAELERFEKTYQPFPPTPADWRRLPQWGGQEPFFLPPQA